MLTYSEGDFKADKVKDPLLSHRWREAALHTAPRRY